MRKSSSSSADAVPLHYLDGGLQQEPKRILILLQTLWIDCFQELLHAAQMTCPVWETPCQHQQIILATDLIPLLLLDQDQTSVSDEQSPFM